MTPLPSSIRIGVHESGEQPWIEWTGGECPVEGDTRVEIRLGDRNPEITQGLARVFGWSHAGFKNLDAHITAYRVVQS